MVWLVIVEWLARLVLLLLLGLSVWSISIVIDRRRFFKAVFTNINDLEARLQAELKRYPTTSQIETAYSLFVNAERPALEKGLPILGTLGATTPFVGLFGTILGIIVSFGQLSRGQSDSNAVMFALAEALLLTAVGLLVAIPAVVAFNYFSRQAKAVIGHLHQSKDSYLLERSGP